MMHSDQPLILVADDDARVLKIIQVRLRELGYRVNCASDKQQLLELLGQEEPVLLLLDLCFGNVDGVQLLPELLRRRPHLCAVIITAFAAVETAVSAIKLGAFDYLTKPLDLSRLGVVVERAIEKHVTNRRLKRLEELLVEREAVQPMLGDSLAMQHVRELIAAVADTDASVLILGETGTGKELVARLLHEQSHRRQGPFVPVNMAALPRELAESMLFGHEKGAFTGADKAQPGYCEAANKGTLFLDEIGEMDLSLQGKMLRFLQERTVQRVGSTKSHTVDVRLVAATHRDLLARVQEGQFREDLYYRVHTIPIVVPTLCERREDIPLLANHFLRRAVERYRKDLRSFTDAAMQALTDYDWPGNVRQLEHVVERVAILCKRPEIDLPQLPPELLQPRAQPNPPEASRVEPANSDLASHPGSRGDDLRRIDQLEKQAILEALQRTQGNVQQAAKTLGLGQATVYRKIKLYGLRTEPGKRSGSEGQ